jgi:Helicase conserved C-terminal domain
MRMRSHFALRFGEEKRDDGRGENRKEHVRKAFNSPFWPFVLATTSVGQEGLDFHNYCHAIVHWNLPSNPVDLEQREGRIHRYKGHAVRKNLAAAYGLQSVTTHARDPWRELFEVGHDQRADDALDLTPYWVFAGPAKIERHAPMLPLSRDIDRLDTLLRSLAVYRMVFGQNRQEDLLAYLLNHLTEEQIRAMMEDLTINLEPPHTARRASRELRAQQ